MIIVAVGEFAINQELFMNNNYIFSKKKDDYSLSEKEV